MLKKHDKNMKKTMKNDEKRLAPGTGSTMPAFSTVRARSFETKGREVASSRVFGSDSRLLQRHQRVVVQHHAIHRRLAL